MTARSEFERELHGPVAAFDLLTETEIAELLTLFRTVQEQERTGLAEALDRIGHAVPRPLRGIGRRIMFGDNASR